MNSRLSSLRCSIIGSTDVPERLLASGSLCHPTAINQPPVLLTYLFEVTKPWFPQSRLIPSLIDTLNDEYPSLNGGEDLNTQFEALLKRVNQQLNQISESGETDWIGSLNGIIVCTFEDQLLFSQTGNCPAYLLQRNRIRQITEEPNDEQSHPLKTFANLASGSLQTDDRILLANQELYREISLDALRRVIGSNSPYCACLLLIKELKQNRNSAVSATLLQVSEGTSNNPVEPQELLLDEIFEHRVKRFKRKATPIVKSVYSGARSGVISADRLTRDELVPRARQAVETGTAMLKAWNEKRISTAVLNQTSIEIIVPTTQPVKITISSIVATTIKLWTKPQSRKAVALVVSLMLLLAVTVSLRNRFHAKQTQPSPDAPLLHEAQSLSDKADDSIHQQQDAAALQYVSQAKAILPKLSGSEAAALANRLDGQADSLTHTIRLSVAMTLPLSEPASLLLYAKPYLYAADFSTASLTRLDERTSGAMIHMALPDKTDAPLSLSPATDGSNAGFVLTKAAHTYRIPQDTASLTAVSPADGQFLPASTLSSYASNLYFLDPVAGKLTRYANTGTAYGSGSNSINPTKYDLKNMVSVAIDGSIYLLNADGSVRKFSAGQPDPGFALRGFPIGILPLVKPAQLLTDADANDLFIMDSGLDGSTARLIETSKEGTFVQAFGFTKDCKDVRASALDLTNRTVWILTADSIKKFNLP